MPPCYNLVTARLIFSRFCPMLRSLYFSPPVLQRSSITFLHLGSWIFSVHRSVVIQSFLSHQCANIHLWDSAIFVYFVLSSSLVMKDTELSFNIRYYHNRMMAHSMIKRQFSNPDVGFRVPVHRQTTALCCVVLSSLARCSLSRSVSTAPSGKRILPCLAPCRLPAVAFQVSPYGGSGGAPSCQVRSCPACVQHASCLRQLALFLQRAVPARRNATHPRIPGFF